MQKEIAKNTHNLGWSFMHRTMFVAFKSATDFSFIVFKRLMRLKMPKRIRSLKFSMDGFDSLR